jgi:hypothetical protein
MKSIDFAKMRSNCHKALFRKLLPRRFDQVIRTLFNGSVWFLCHGSKAKITSSVVRTRPIRGKMRSMELV